MRNRTLVFVRLLGLFCVAVVASRHGELRAQVECGPQRPIRISGAFCGRALFGDGGDLPGLVVSLHTEDGRLVASSQTDAHGWFQLGATPRGVYYVQVRDSSEAKPSKLHADGRVELRDNKSASCSRPITLNVGIMECTGGVEDKRPIKPR